MKTVTKKLVSFLLVMCMAFGVQSNIVLAEEETPVVTEVPDMEESEDLVEEENANGTLDTNRQDGFEQIKSGDATENQIIDNSVQPNEVLLNYLCVGEVNLQSPQEENVLVSLGSGEEELSNVTLTVVKDDGTVDEIAMTEKDGNIYRFTRLYNVEEKGVYSITHVSYEISGQKVDIDLAAIEIYIQYGVDTEIPSAVAISEDDIEISVASVEDGNVKKGAAEVEATLEESIGDMKISKSRSRVEGRAKSEVVVVLDPGHGGSDSGASANNLTEKNLTLKIAKYAKQELEEYYGVRVYMTREDDRFVELIDRAKYAEQMDADILVSIHMNSSTSSAATGAEVWYPNSSYNSSVYNEGKAVAQQIQDKLVEAGMGDRGIKYRNATDGSVYDDGSIMDYYSVIRNSKLRGFPGIIVEHAFLTNSSDAAKLKNESFIQKLGIADATGIAQYYGLAKVDFSQLFDFDFYVNRYPDIKAAYGNDKKGALNHFLTVGMKEKRQGCSSFNVTSYRNRYPDLRLAFEDDYQSYYAHYIISGKSEGRIATGTVKLVPITRYEGMDYSDVYKYEYYMDRYSDLKKLYSDNDVGALKHFVNFGMEEGRQGSEEFHVKSYQERYKDLRDAFGNNLKSYYLHYITNGKAEGRNAKYDSNEGDSSENDAKKNTVYNGKDYSLVYDYDYYVEKNSDVKQAYKENPEKVLEHFVLFGMREGRRANEQFEAKSYRNKYSDLRMSFRNDLPKYYLHYIDYGKREGRVAKGITSLQNTVTKYRGKDYSAVYSFDYYMDRYSDMKKNYEFDDVGALEHFVEFGMREGRRGSKEFDLAAYKNNYPDLRKAFNDDKVSYYLHYIDFGKREGRKASESKYYAIMGESSTTVAQMVEYYNSKAKYPSYYETKDAKTIEEFCKIYDEECKAEGVRTEVAFCQAMKETGYLKFGGDVKINQFNFAGLGATGNGVSGNSFPNMRIGIRAHIQHLKAYACEDELNQDCVDERFKYVTRGCAPYVEWLGIKENPVAGKGWASEKGYGYSIIDDYIKKLLSY